MIAMQSPVFVMSAICLVRQNSCLPWMRKSATDTTSHRETTEMARESSTACRTRSGLRRVRRWRLVL